MELMEYFADFSLYDNRDPQWREGRETQTLSTAELHAQDASLIELRTTVLPSLQHKLVHLCESMDVPDLGENPMPNMIQVPNLLIEIRLLGGSQHFPQFSRSHRFRSMPDKPNQQP
ncbi:hypothetical protein MJO29_014941 [Puccinia striiformis f. sp. tritici]|nr:hypothetical protein MJO29_014941 [Puccinia striiformis f. sp. tritici]